MTQPSQQQYRRPPWVLLLPAVIGAAYLFLPLLGLLVRAPWSTIGPRLSEPGALTALRLSVVTATITTAVCLVLGVPVAFVLARTRFPGQRLVRALVTLPLVLPPVVGGVALFTAFGRRGIVGMWLDRWFGIQLPFTTTAVVMSQTFVALPFLVIAVPPGNPKKITSLKDLTDPKLKVVLCAPTVPCGAAATKAEKAAGLTVKPVSEAQDVKSALTPVELGEADRDRKSVV